MSKRIESLGQINVAADLASIGACRDIWWMNTVISCYRCGMIFDVDEILHYSKRKETSFKMAGLLLHAQYNPWCLFLEGLPIQSRKEILGKLL